MAHPPRLRPEDRADFTAVVDLALGTTDIRDALAADPGGRSAAHLRADALARADTLAAAAAEPYRVYLLLRGQARPRTRPPLGEGSLLPALAVLTPLVAGTSAGALLLLGGVLRAARTPGPLPGSLAAAGWVLALVAALTGLVALAALLRAALRRDPVPPAPEQVEHARLVWRQALLDHGVLPHLRRLLTPSPEGAEAALTPRSPADTLTPCPARARKDRTPCSD